jgi:uncharacterized membrane protein SirB2
VPGGLDSQWTRRKHASDDNANDSLCMNEFLTHFAQVVRGRRTHDVVVDLLSTVPGLPPMVQTIHLLGIAAMMGSIVLISLRSLGLATPSQEPSEMAVRLAPWFWSALPILFLSGVVFVIARPERYFANAVFGYKFAMLVPAIVLAAVLLRIMARGAEHRVTAKVLAGVTLALCSASCSPAAGLRTPTICSRCDRVLAQPLGTR